MSDRPLSVSAALDEAPLSRFHTRAIFTAGMGFFTDAYDLFIIGTATTLISKEWGLSSSQTGLVNSITLLSAFLGALLFGRIADIIGRKRTYGLEAALMVFGALASAFAPSFIWLLIFRFILGIGVGGDYPMSAVLMTEYSNVKSRGKLVGLVFAMQALGTVTGYIVALALLSANVHPDMAWRIMLGFGAIPAAGVIYLRRKMPESPRYLERVEGRSAEAAAAIEKYSEGVVVASVKQEKQARITLGQFLSNRKYLLYLLGTAGSWFVFDYAYYGNSVSAPLIVKSVLGKHGAHVLTEAIALQLIVFSVFAVPGYYLAANYMDRIGHRRLQLIGFFFMGLAFLLIGVVPHITTEVTPFLLLFGISYFFAEFGPNETTFVLAGEVFPTSMRSTGHGISAGIAKFGAFLGVYLFPIIKSHFGVSGALEFSFGMALIGILLTLLLPEPAGKSLDELSGEEAIASAEAIVRSAEVKVTRL
ncbi:MFS transporter [Ferrimicrobium acidiphilum]|uniref:MFS transporter n=1 Tax=Ferrimicrobium acidiphilum TaxID=121039 RepID=UPI0023F027A8|nr:MFS transporter [Ferrimicrobium acidiphilum]